MKYLTKRRIDQLRTKEFPNNSPVFLVLNEAYEYLIRNREHILRGRLDSGEDECFHSPLASYRVRVIICKNCRVALFLYKRTMSKRKGQTIHCNYDLIAGNLINLFLLR